jgi:hypothetical protein
VQEYCCRRWPLHNDDGVRSSAVAFAPTAGQTRAIRILPKEEQQAEIATLKSRNRELESELAALRASQAEILRRQKLEAGKGR